MTPIVEGLLGIAVVAAVIDWAAVWSTGPRAPRVERIAKPSVLLALIGVALVAPATGPGGDAVRPWLVAGLAASLVGDVFLLPPGRFVPGLVAFLLAHVAYLVAFVQLPGDVPWLVAGIVAAVVLAATVGRVLLRAAGRVGLAAPVAAYLIAITLMAVAATRTGEVAAIAGAWLFVASDAMLAWGRFRVPLAGSPRGAARLRGAVMVTYHLSQVLLVAALLR